MQFAKTLSLSAAFALVFLAGMFAPQYLGHGEPTISAGGTHLHLYWGKIDSQEKFQELIGCDIESRVKDFQAAVRSGQIWQDDCHDTVAKSSKYWSPSIVPANSPVIEAGKLYGFRPGGTAEKCEDNPHNTSCLLMSAKRKPL